MLVAPTASPARSDLAEPTNLMDLLAGAAKVVLAGHPRPAARIPGSVSTVFQPKGLLLELVATQLEAVGGPPARVANPHFLRIAEWTEALTVLHASALDLTCPVPLARNIQLLDGEDLLGLAEERRLGDPAALRRQRIDLIDHVLGLGPMPAALAGTAASVLALDQLLAHAGRLPAEGARPVQWCACDMETGPYNFLQLRRQPRLRTTHVRVLLDDARSGGRPYLVAFATPRGLRELGPVLRALAALADAAAGAAPPMLEVFFFGTPEELVAVLADQPRTSFFGDNFRCPGIRFLFAPFAASDLLAMVAQAAGTIDSCHGGVLDALGRGLRVRSRLVIGPDGRFDAWRDGEAVAEGIAWDAIHAADTLAGRHYKADRARERPLLAALTRMT